MTYKLTAEDITTAQKLAKMMTIQEWLQFRKTWQDAPDSDPRKERELAIAEYASQCG